MQEQQESTVLCQSASELRMALRPRSRLLVAVGAALFMILVLAPLLALRPPVPVPLWVVDAVCCLVILLGAADLLQRVYRFRPDSVAVRRLGFWRVQALPERIALFTRAGRALSIRGAKGEPFHLYIPSLWTSHGTLNNELAEFYAKQGRILRVAS